jgi:hypothetical protein
MSRDVPLIIHDWNRIVQEIKEFADIAKFYQEQHPEMASFQNVSI